EMSAVTAEQLQQQQAFLQWLNSAHQLMALQQLQQQQHLQMAESGGGGALPPPPMSEFINMSAANLAHVYPNMHNGIGHTEEAKPELESSDREDEEKVSESKEPESNQGMSRRALRFKSHKR